MISAKPDMRQRKADLPWLRPVAVLAIGGLHLLAVYRLALPTKAMAGMENPVELTIAAEEPPPAPPPPPPPPAPEPPPPPPPPLPSPPEPEPEPPPEPPKKVVEEAPALPPPPPPKPKPQLPPKPLPPKPQPPQPPQPEPPPSPEPPKQPDPAVEAARAAAAQAKLTYGDKVAVELRRRRVHSFRRSKAEVSFAINAKGEVVSAQIVQSSGDEDLDAAILRSVRSIEPGSPPDGGFEATWWITVRD